MLFLAEEAMRWNGFVFAMGLVLVGQPLEKDPTWAPLGIILVALSWMIIGFRAGVRYYADHPQMRTR